MSVGKMKIGFLVRWWKWNTRPWTAVAGKNHPDYEPGRTVRWFSIGPFATWVRW